MTRSKLQNGALGCELDDPLYSEEIEDAVGQCEADLHTPKCFYRVPNRRGNIVVFAAISRCLLSAQTWPFLEPQMVVLALRRIVTGVIMMGKEEGTTKSVMCAREQTRGEMRIRAELVDLIDIFASPGSLGSEEKFGEGAGIPILPKIAQEFVSPSCRGDERLLYLFTFMETSSLQMITQLAYARMGKLTEQIYSMLLGKRCNHYSLPLARFDSGIKTSGHKDSWVKQ
ncbi:hypothetical protein B0H14DRAFT_2573968 [Mycena olivaceomarginata]|nr:hypothetical protein B0H14DRAFT_2573968 [Mycena olivaceomarginata]